MEDWKKLAQASEDNRRKKIPERRKKPDLVLRLITLSGAVSWLLLLPVLVFVEKARPVLVTFFDRWMGLEGRDYWDADAYRYAFYLMLLIMLVSVGGLVMNAFRKKRSTDSWRVNLILILMISLAGAAYYLINIAQ